MKMRRCEDEKVRYRPPLLEEPCAQTLSGKRTKVDQEIQEPRAISSLCAPNFQPSVWSLDRPKFVHSCAWALCHNSSNLATIVRLPCRRRAYNRQIATNQNLNLT